MMDSFFYLVILAGVIAGGGCGLLGVYIVGLRLPFMGIYVSHAAMAGTVLSYLLGIDSYFGPMLFSVAASVPLALVKPERSRLDPNVALAILFSLMLGLTFLGIGLIKDSRSEVLGLLWGSILFVRGGTVIAVMIVTLVFAIFALSFNKELKALLFSRSIASATGVHETFVYCLFLAICAVLLAVNIPLIGGLMIFSLITNPAAAAYQISRGHRAVVIWAIAFGMLSSLVGFLVSYYLNLPTGACIVLVSASIFGVSAIYRAFLARID